MPHSLAKEAGAADLIRDAITMYSTLEASLAARGEEDTGLACALSAVRQIADALRQVHLLTADIDALLALGAERERERLEAEADKAAPLRLVTAPAGGAAVRSLPRCGPEDNAAGGSRPTSARTSARR